MLPVVGMVVVGPGTWHPTFPPSPEETAIPVPAFLLDTEPVTNAEYRAFVERNPEWRKGSVSPTFADGAYLARWQGPLDLGWKAPADAPVTDVSWFAARAYCEERGARLPTEAEWELAAAASPTSADGSSDPAFVQQILDWYAVPTPAVLSPVGRTAPNVWGARDLHGLVWEWVDDFSELVADDGGSDPLRFCGGAALAAQDTRDYPAFVRTSFRASLKADYTTPNLGFRCAADL